MALHIKTNNEVVDLSSRYPKESEIPVQDLQSMVGGYIEVVNFPRSLIIKNIPYSYMVVDEEGKLKNYPVNHLATGYLTNTPLKGDVIVGDVVLLEKHEIS